MPDPIKNCMTCAHACEDPVYSGFEFAHCMLSGFYCTVERRHNSKCDANFSGWQPREPKPPKQESLMPVCTLCSRPVAQNGWSSHPHTMHLLCWLRHKLLGKCSGPDGYCIVCGEHQRYPTRNTK